MQARDWWSGLSLTEKLYYIGGIVAAAIAVLGAVAWIGNNVITYQYRRVLKKLDDARIQIAKERGPTALLATDEECIERSSVWRWLGKRALAWEYDRRMNRA